MLGAAARARAAAHSRIADSAAAALVLLLLPLAPADLCKGCFHDALHLLQLVFVLVLLVHAILRPLHVLRTGASVPQDAILRHNVGALQLVSLNTACHANVSLVELQRKVEAKSTHKPCPFCRFGQLEFFHDDLCTLQPGKANHVGVDIHIGAIELGNQEIQQEDGRRRHEGEDHAQQNGVVLEVSVIVLVQLDGDREQGDDCH
mmetsp:Transcript_56348/g.91194  ORF Transcript_56348/g.91194 Transcript_56348/m.91194 type:complete len:204 (+) Transcript_56348:305-916(+)